MPYVIGHRNPDTDAICAAIAYANLLQQTGMPDATAAACGTPNLRTKFTLKKAGVNPPRLLMDVRPTTEDICKTKVMVARLDESFMDVYRRMQKHRLKAIPVVDGERRVLGILPLMNLMKLLIPDEQDLGEQRILQASLARVRNVLGASFQHEVDIHNENESLVMYIAAMSTEGFVGRISEYPAARLMVLVGDRPSIQKAAIDVGVRSLLITGGARISEELLARARERNVAVLCSPVDTAMTALLVRTAKSVRAALRTDVLQFGPRVLLHTIRDQVQDANQDVFPVVDDGVLYGVFAKSDMIDPQPAQLILVDHNEYGQAVQGAEEAHILEVIDHHRIGGGLVSREPIRFINETVGSTCTIIARMFREKAIMPEPPIALCMASGIISDTLFLKSPTTTEVDHDMLAWLRSYLDVNLEDYAREFFAEGSTLSMSSAADVLASDRKEYKENNWTIAVSQVEEPGMDRFWERKADLYTTLDAYVRANPVDFACLMITDITLQSSYLLVAGDERICDAIDYPELEKHLFDLPGIVSRKKQLLPHLMWVLNRVHR